MEKAKILFIGDMFTGLKEVISEYNSGEFQVEFLDEIDERSRNESIANAKYLLTGNVDIDQKVLAQAENALLVQNTGVGCNNIDLDFAKRLKIPVANAPGSNAIAVSELTLGLILSLYRKLVYLDKSTKDGNWLMWNLRYDCFELSGKKHGIIGLGQIGKEVAFRSRAFGTKVYYYDVLRADTKIETELGVTYLPKDDLLRESDIISIHIPLTSKTKNLISDREIILMKSNAIIINVSRGGIINEESLYKGLLTGKIAGAALDVWQKEPVEKNNPLLGLDNVIATPHVGAGTLDTIKRVYKMCFENIKRVEYGIKPEHIVNE